MAAQATEHPVGTCHLRGSITDRGLDQLAGPLCTLAHRLCWDILWTQHDTGLLHKLGVLTNDIAHSSIVDLLKGADVLDGLDKCRGIPAHVAYHDLNSSVMTGVDNRLSFLARQAHWFLNQDMLAMLHGSQGSIRVVFITIQYQDCIEISLPGQISIVGISVFGGHGIALSQSTEQFL